MEPDATDSALATPADYSDVLYPVYFEVGEWQHVVRDAMIAFLVQRSDGHPAFHFAPDGLRTTAHGYEVDLPMQLIPEVVRALAERNVAIYQVVRRQPR